ncbi:glycosyltransferase family 2 protein [Clostridiales bacterium FE2011]|nr:glycosyltransferase family 2 protein [Clostridiales bacterium FE2011]
MEKSYAVIVVTYNRKELLKENIECLLSQRPVIPHIIIIDNHSTDGTKEYIADYISEEKIEYCDTGSNLGGAGGFSFGIKYAAEKDYDYIWVMDDDCMPTENALEEFIKADKELNGQYGFLSSKVLWKDGSICTMNLQRKTLTKTLECFDNNINQVVMASFVSLFLKREIVVEMGLPIKEFFIWTDDWEYTRRISLKYPCYAVRDSVVIHKSKSNIGANIASESADRLDRFNYLYRNDVYLYRREGIKGFCYEAARLTGHCIRVLTKSKDNKGKRLAKIYKGTISGLKFKPEIEYIT